MQKILNKKPYSFVVVNSGNSPGWSHVSSRTKSITNRDQARHIKCRIQPRGERHRALPWHQTQFEEREISGLTLNSHPTPRRGPESRPGSTSNLEGEASGQSLSPIITTHVFYEDSCLHLIKFSTRISHVPNALIFQWRRLRMTADIPECQSQQSNAAIRAVIEGF